MKLIEALEIVNKHRAEKSPIFRAFLACGFSPLHLQTFLEAHLLTACPDCKPEILSGLYGDFWGNLTRLKQTPADAGIVVLEWSDLDLRLSLRSLGSWSPSVLPEILDSVRDQMALLADAVEEIASRTSVVISLPTLPIPPISFPPGWQSSAFELELRSALSSAGSRIGQTPNVRLLNAARLDSLSAPKDRLDAKSEIVSGFPYRLSHASVMADLLSRMAVPVTPKKGLITDLDDTLWSGIVGEMGADGVFWDIEHGGQLHGLYQRLLHSLSEAGVLIGAASKNDPKVVAQAFERRDLILPPRALFPVEAHWGPKSASVGRILDTWNIMPEATVFIDDSPLELAEVKAAFPGIECILFPKEDPQGLFELMYRIRDLFGKPALSEEDRIRRESIRQAQRSTAERAAYGGDLMQFLAQAEAEFTFEDSKVPPDPRALELVNKTNQFNLNGRRYTDAAWQAFLDRPGSFLLVAAYRDKYGPLGKIAVTGGEKRERTLHLEAWVMSCRAFGRRIEYRCMEELFKRYDVDEIVFDFQPTNKNGPLREFISAVIGVAPEPGCRLLKESFLVGEGANTHRVLEISNG